MLLGNLVSRGLAGPGRPVTRPRGRSRRQAAQASRATCSLDGRAVHQGARTAAWIWLSFGMATIILVIIGPPSPLPGGWFTAPSEEIC